MSGWAVGISAGVGFLGSAMGASSARSAAARQADAQLRATQETNANNYRMFGESRGSTGSAILPEYLKSIEASLGADAASVSRALFGYGGGPAGRLAEADGMLRRYRPAIEAGDALTIDLATGKVAANRRSSLAPVLAARTSAAKGRAAAISAGLDETLASLRASQTGRGFRGGASTFDINRAVAATTGARASAADMLSQAELENALAVQGLDESNLQLELGALDMPFARAQQRINFGNLPSTALADYYRAAMAPLDYFRIAPGTPPYQQTPQIGYVPGSGQVAGAALSGLGQTMGQYFAQQQLMSELAKYYRQPALGGTAWTGGNTVNPLIAATA